MKRKRNREINKLRLKPAFALRPFGISEQKVILLFWIATLLTVARNDGIIKNIRNNKRVNILSLRGFTKNIIIARHWKCRSNLYKLDCFTWQHARFRQG